MIIIEITTDQRSYVLDMAELLMPAAKRQSMARRLTDEAVKYEGAFMVSITREERTWITTRAHSTMESMARRDVNAWTSWEYASLEHLTYALYVDAAE